MQVTGTRLRAATLAALVFTSTTLTTAANPAPAAAATTTPAQVIIAAAESHLGRPWVYAATGPYAFDCSGLVYAVFRDTGYFYVIGNGRYRTVGAMWSLFASRGLASTRDPQPGDLVVYGGGAHIGIYIGGGKVISTLVTGVTIHSLYALTIPFTTFLHTGMQTAAAVMTYSEYVRSGPSYGYGVIATVYAGQQLPILAYKTESTGRTWAQVRLSTGATGWFPAWRARNVGFIGATQTAYMHSGSSTAYPITGTLWYGYRDYAYSSTSDLSRRVWLRVKGPAYANFLIAGQTAP